MKNLTRYKKAVRAAHRYNDPKEADEFSTANEVKAIERHEQKFDALLEKTYEIFESLTSDEELRAIEWLAENSLYGYHNEVC